MESLIDLHHDIMFFLILIIVMIIALFKVLLSDSFFWMDAFRGNIDSQFLLQKDICYTDTEGSYVDYKIKD